MGEASSYNHLTIYRQPERYEYLASARAAAPFFDRITRAWIVADPDLCRELLSSPALDPAPAVEHYRNMPTGLGEQFQSVAFAFENIPLSMSGERHAEARRRAASFMASRHEAIHAWVEAELPGLLAPLAWPGRVELMGEVIKPTVRGLFAALVGVDLPKSLKLDQVSGVFDKSMSMTRRMALEAEMAALEAHLRAQLADDVDLGMRLGLLVIGKDALVGTLAESLVQLFRDNAGAPLGSIPYPRMPQQTAVPFVERVAVAPVSVAGLELAPGDRVRLVLQTYALSPASEHHRFFGAGAHACLGRPLSLELWTTIVSHLVRMRTRVSVLNYRLPRDSYVFNVATTFEIEVTE